MKRFILPFNLWLNESKLDEALPLSSVRLFSKVESDSTIKEQIINFIQALKNTCKDSFTSKNKYRLYIPANDLDFSKMTSFVKKEIEAFFNHVNKTGNSVISKAAEGDKEYKIIDYIGNQIHVPGQKNPTKITKVLQKLDQKALSDLYCTDPLRDGANKIKSEKYIVISSHFYDIAGMSAGRDWTSCMDILNQPDKTKAKVKVDDEDFEDFDEEDYEEIESKLGSDVHIEWDNKNTTQTVYTNPRKDAIEYIEADIAKGTLIAYLILKDDQNIEKPLARILLKPYNMCPNGDEEQCDGKWVYFPEQTIYGLRISSFRQKMIDICCNAQKELQGDWEEVWLKCADGLYNDYATPVRNQNLSKEVDKKEIFDPENAKLGDKKYKDVQSTGIAHLNRKGKLI